MAERPDVEEYGRGATAPPLLVQITRGLAPAPAIASAVLGAQRHGWGYELVAGLPAVDAKNEAVRLAYAAGADLVLVEDDVIAPWAIWPTASDAIYAADAICRGGETNTVRDVAGGVIYTGTCFIRIPRWAMERMGYPSQPLFRSGKFLRTAHDLEPDPTRPPDGTRSDMHLCWLAARHGVPMRIFGTAAHLLHEASGPGRNVSAVEVVGG